MSELEDILNYLETTSLEPHDDYVSEFSYKDQKTLWKYIKELQQENKEYKEVIDKAIKYINGAYEMAIYTKSVFLGEENIEDLLDILKEVE